MQTFTFIVLASLFTSLLGLVGGFLLLWKRDSVMRGARYFMSFAAGSILGAAFLDLLPEAIEAGTVEPHAITMSILLGILLFFALEKLLILHHHSHDDEQETELHTGHFPSLVSARPLVIFGDALHNFLDGAVIAVAFLTDTSVGIVTLIAVVAHELPQEIGDFSILLHSGMERSRVIFWNVMGALVSPLGALVGYAAFSAFEKIESLLVGFVVGNFVYIALADLIPTIKHEKRVSRSWIQIGLVLIGITIVWATGRFLHHG